MFKSQLKTLSVIVLSSLIISQSFSADDSKKVDVSESTFKCLSALAASGRFFVDNILGNLDATLSVANSSSGGNYPPGSLLTLVPDEAMIKHQEGWNPATNDWEFFLLGLSAEGTSILARGGTEVASPSGSCFGCHQLARSEWDLVCGVDHGCAPIAFTLEQIRNAQAMDPRCINEN
ncbi:MAG: hypothetical protein P8N11_08130 [Gammaproteobacteria bacterium]|jgi:hypothetical protein|nr:hypothetical protein [Gammaproteobacteria bacterium]